MIDPYKQELIEYWKKKVWHDKEFVEPLVNAYGNQLLDLRDAIEHRSHSAAVTFPLFQYTNEILDFLDGNGFSCEYQKGSVTLTLLEEPEGDDEPPHYDFDILPTHKKE